jgi:tRNA pseudouridine38-40 synthase
MARYQVILAYDGSQYQGFQKQRQANTVQATVEAALRKLGWRGEAILAAGRTDTGVHATGQVIAFDLDWSHGSPALQNALNAALPEAVAAQRVVEVPAEFHPRYDAAARRYRYRIYTSPVRQPIGQRFAWRVWPEPDRQLLAEAASILVGTHDFAAFGSPPRKGGRTWRTIFDARWLTGPKELVFEVTGNAFLYRMVRRLVAFQVAAATGKTTVEELANHLQNPGDTSAAGTAPAHALCLVAVYYPGRTGAVNYLDDLVINGR